MLSLVLLFKSEDDDFLISLSFFSLIVTYAYKEIAMTAPLAPTSCVEVSYFSINQTLLLIFRAQYSNNDDDCKKKTYI